MTAHAASQLTAGATRAQAAEVAARSLEAHASCNRTCEIGMTGATYRHVVELWDATS